VSYPNYLLENEMNALPLDYLTIARGLDVGLVLLLILTLALVLIKGIDLYWPKRLYGKTPLLAQMKASALFGMTEAEHRKLAFKLDEGLEQLERGMPLLGTVAASAPFIGLAGTVLHIIDALSKISGAALDISLISGPISTALFSTLLGLASAVLASVAYNLYSRKLQLIEGQCQRLINKAAP
jgi:pilus assembly protein TadC